ncbi:hypothetical protein N3K66_006297 [Trichothecium roseum]|uniref:Uncharacterized protein n=1 Tax=Trichothecium roseum TaxID=47278 RepID=A0ACC0UUY5_9HYPO|nr:hypothetical protein N3K66_006297 [Trichothecium roseum]
MEARVYCDILIGAEGIHSTVSKHILGENDAATHPKNAGWWAIMALKAYELARASIGSGPVNIEDAREHMWIGDNTYLMHNVLNHGQIVQLILSVRDDRPESSTLWHLMISKEEIKNQFKEWPDHLTAARHYLWNHSNAATYVSGLVCIMGDAAHATTPWQGSGAGMSVEDSLILSTPLGISKTPAEAIAALRVYEMVRRPRNQRLVKSSRWTGDIMTGKGPETGLDLAKLKEKLLPIWDFIINFDNKKHTEEATQLLVKELGEA